MKKLYLIPLIIFSVLVIFIIALSLLFNWKVKSPNTNLNDYKVVEIQQGETTDQITNKLMDKGIILDRTVFKLAVRLTKKNLKAGYYQFSPKASIKQVIDQLALGESSVVKVTIPEGWRLEQIAQELNEKGILNYQDFLNIARDNEGKLFPDTYFFTAKMNPQKVFLKFTENYAKHTENLNVTNSDLILASIVEREAVSDQDRPLIAGIYKNRLDRGMKLDADPTTQYAKDNELSNNLSLDQLLVFDYWQKITIADYLKYDSPYNTYLVSGLPKGPICNPGIKSIEAAIHPQSSEYLYFLHKNGKIYPSKTIEEHDLNRERVLGASLQKK